MQDRDRIEALMRQADFHMLRFDKRRDYSWKIALSFWGATLGAATVLRDAPLEICSVAIAGLGVVWLHWTWLKGVYKADQKDKKTAWQARNEALPLISKNLPIPPDETGRSVYEDWSVQFQILTTILLVVAIAWYLLLPQ